MHYIKQSVSITKYQTSAIKIKSEYEIEMPKNNFRPMTELHKTAVESHGWVKWDNCLHQAKLFEGMDGPYVKLALRLDRKRVPRAIVQAELDIELKVHSGKKLKAAEKAEIRHGIEERLLLETSPTSNVYNALWNYATGDVFLFCTSRKIQDMFAKLFKETFDCKLQQFQPQEETGREFLTWLWSYGVENDWTINDMIYGIDDLLEMESEDKQECKARIAGPAPTSTEEAQASLDCGKQVKKMRLVVCYEAREWEFTVDADSFNISSLKLKKEVSKDIHERFHELAEDLQKFYVVFETIYSYFLQQREEV